MARKTAIETPAQLAVRLRREGRMQARVIEPGEADKALDEMVKRSIAEHGA